MAAKKLQIKAGYKVLVINEADNALSYLSDGPDGVEITMGDDDHSGDYDVVLVFAASKHQIEQFVPQGIGPLKKGGLLWIAYPKKSSYITTDITRDHGWEILPKIGYQGVSMISLDDTWTALRIRPIGESTGKKVTVPEIDMEKRIVIIPDDLKEALQAEGLLEKFEKMSFTHRKEVVLEIVTAKKPETRQRRIAKTIAALK